MLIKHFTAFLPKKAAQLEAVEGLNDTAIIAIVSARVGSISGKQTRWVV